MRPGALATVDASRAAVDLDGILAVPPYATVVRGLPVDDGGDAFVALGSALGRPIDQDRAGNVLYAVEDAASRGEYDGIRGSKLQVALPFHTDSPSGFGGGTPDVFGLLCVRSAAAGGETELCDGSVAWDGLLATDPASARRLQEPVTMDRTPEARPGEPTEVDVAPVVVDGDGRPRFRYNRVWIDLAGRRLHGEVPADVRTACDALDEALERAPRWSVRLDTGEALFVDNARALHRRGAFEDPPGAPGRLLWRLWLRRGD
jgi:Taurine catabolism dioxygenase TauD, TfdA family